MLRLKAVFSNKLPKGEFKDMGNESIMESRKYYQRNKMLSVIRFHEDVSRYDVKKQTAYSITTVLSTIDEMIRDELIYE